MDERELADFYPEEYWGRGEPSERWIRVSQSEKTRFLRACGLDRGRILDVGCGAGFFLRALDPNRWERFGIEPGWRAYGLAAEKLGRERIFFGKLTDANLADSDFDVVTFWSTLEHTNDPRSNLIEARRILKPGGTLIVQVPNAASYQVKLFGGCWFAFDVPRHRYHFTPQVLRWALEETGFEIYRMSFFSKSHNAHAFKHSLKLLLGGGRGALGWLAFQMAAPLIGPVDSLMSAFGLGATMTVAAR
jgi:SAM-dependent methyltransferase